MLKSHFIYTLAIGGALLVGCKEQDKPGPTTQPKPPATKPAMTMPTGDTAGPTTRTETPEAPPPVPMTLPPIPAIPNSTTLPTGTTGTPSGTSAPTLPPGVEPPNK
jgi:hypothetical protein